MSKRHGMNYERMHKRADISKYDKIGLSKAMYGPNIPGEDKLKKLDYAKHYNKDIYEKGEAWYNSGLTLEDAPVELQNDINFVNGYERGRRLALIEEMQNNKTR